MKKGIYIEITPFFPTDDCFRGSFIYDQVKALKETGNFADVLVFRPMPIYSKVKSYNYKGIKVYLFPCIESPSYILNGIFDSINMMLFKKWFEKNFNNIINEITVAHAHVSTFALFPLILKKMSPRIKTVIQHHDLDPYTVRNGKWADKYWNIKYKYKRNKSIFEKIDYHLCVSDKVEESLIAFPRARKGEVYQSYLSKLEKIENYPSANISKSIVLCNGVNSSIFYKTEKKSNDLYKIGCIGNFVDLKDQITLIKAIKLLINQEQLSHIRLSLIGSGPLLNECKQYVNSNHLNEFISFSTEVFHEQLSDFYRSLDLFVLPSFFEGFGCVLVEAASCGIPFMTCENQGIESYIPLEERSKWFFPPHDVKRLSQLIKKQIIRREEQKIVQPFDINTLIAKYIKELYK